MGKKKRKKTAKKLGLKKLTTPRAFVLGVLVGLGLYWLPLDTEFSPTHFSSTEYPPLPSDSIFTANPPTTAPLLTKEGFVLAYNGQTRNPHWVYHRLTSQSLEKNASRAECEFHEDSTLPSLIRATKSDYLGSGFDRGHLCPAGDCETQKAMDESFVLSNITPQVPTLNRGYWKKVENHVRELTKEHRAVHVFSGPLYLSKKGRDGKKYVSYQVIGKQEVAVPTHFFTLIFVELPSNKMQHKGYIIPNQTIDSKTSLKKYAVSIDEIEKASGVMFTHILPK